ncbi:hypothetical protein CcCBS67573_g08343 [Chytriomyces confervae]|uniref:Uncharacterized protein n=1 Tax=Chytriomyces confervae TaxID=246404 RepID=A0A507EN08_9FUNG|nr:hypothetical protein CcCBS67573_g08343 [Chytriomyces confervae]
MAASHASSRSQPMMTLNINNLVLSLTNLYALRGIYMALSQAVTFAEPKFYLLFGALSLSMCASVAYHWCERSYRGHLHMGGRRILARNMDAVAEERTLLVVDRVLSLTSIAAVVFACSPDAVLRVASAPQSAWVLPLAVACALVGELNPVMSGTFLCVSGYAWFHGVGWHILVFHLPVLCIAEATKNR